jgi:hypothetical protein
MAEFSPGERVVMGALGPALLGGWWYLAPSYSELFSTPWGTLTLAEILWPAGWLLLLVLLLRATISWLYEAWTGQG